MRSKLEASLVFTVSFLPPDMFHLPPGATTLRWTVRNVAMRFGVSVATAQRIMAKHGLQTVRGSLRPHGKKRWQGPSLKNFKISQDPLFGVTISGIAGLFFESTGPILALCCDGRPLSELHLSELPPTGVEERFEALLVEIRKLQYRLVGFFLPPENDLVDADGFNTLLRLHPNWQVYSDLDERRPDGARFRPRGLLIPSKDKLLRFLDVIDSKRPRDGKIYLLAGGEHSGADTDPVVRQWLAEHRDFKLRYAPFPAIIDWETRAWMEWIQKWINVMTAFPVQAELLDDIAALTSHLRQLPTRPHLDTILIA